MSLSRSVVSKSDFPDVRPMMTRVRVRIRQIVAVNEEKIEPEAIGPEAIKNVRPLQIVAVEE